MQPVWCRVSGRRRCPVLVDTILNMKGKNSDSVAIPIPAATVVPLRDSSEGLEILLLRRNVRLNFAGGAWVFPGGRIDEEDYAQAANRDELTAARHAAVREAKEESGLTLEAERLVCLSHWTTPPSSPKRFSTWFFLAPLPQPQQVVIDGSEIHDFRWYRPQAAIKAYHREEIFIITPPTTPSRRCSASSATPICLSITVVRSPP